MNKLTCIVLYTLLPLVVTLKAVEELNHTSLATEDIHEERHLELPVKLDATVCV